MQPGSAFFINHSKDFLLCRAGGHVVHRILRQIDRRERSLIQNMIIPWKTVGSSYFMRRHRNFRHLTHVLFNAFQNLQFIKIAFMDYEVDASGNRTRFEDRPQDSTGYDHTWQMFPTSRPQNVHAKAWYVDVMKEGLTTRWMHAEGRRMPLVSFCQLADTDELKLRNVVIATGLVNGHSR
jgi:hypothetical protein